MFRTFVDFKNNSESKSYFAVILNPCFYSVLLYRISNKLYNLRIKPAAKIVWFFNRILFNVDIDYRAKIGRGFILVHGLGVVIGCDVVIGESVKVYQGVTIGGNGKERIVNNKKITQPIIGDGCVIYTNACLFGPLILSEKCVVKACEIIVNDRHDKKKKNEVI